MAVYIELIVDIRLITGIVLLQQVVLHHIPLKPVPGQHQTLYMRCMRARYYLL